MQFVQVIMGTQARQGKRWLTACQYQQIQHCRKMVDKICHRLVNLGRGDDVVVLQDKDTSVCKLCKLIDERRKYGL